MDVMDASEVEGWRGAAWLVMHQASSSSGKHPKSFFARLCNHPLLHIRAQTQEREGGGVFK